MLITHLLLVLEVWNGKATYWKSWAGNLLVWSDLTLDPSFKVKRANPNLKVLITHLLLVLEVCSVTPTYRKSWAKNLLIWSDFTMGFSFNVKRCLDGFVEFSFWWIQFASVLRCNRSSYVLYVTFHFVFSCYLSSGITDIQLLYNVY